MIKIINKNNWTGKQAKIRINQTEKTMMCQDIDYIFRLIKTHKNIWKVYMVNPFDNNDNIEFCTVFLMGDSEFDKKKNVTPYYVAGSNFDRHGECTCTRDSTCIYTAIAQLAYNLI